MLSLLSAMPESALMHCNARAERDGNLLSEARALLDRVRQPASRLSKTVYF